MAAGRWWAGLLDASPLVLEAFDRREASWAKLTAPCRCLFDSVHHWRKSLSALHGASNHEGAQIGQLKKSGIFLLHEVHSVDDVFEGKTIRVRKA